MLWNLAIRNLKAHKVQTLVVGSIVFFGTYVSILGGAFLDSVSVGIRRSITQSIAGDIQIFSGKKDVDFSVFGDKQSGDFPDIGQIENFPEVKQAILERDSNVKEVVPQGINLALLAANTTLDRLLTDLRSSKNENPEIEADRIAHVRALTKRLGGIYEANANGLLKATPQEIEATRKAVATALSDEFWSNFQKDRNGSIEFLENKIAPLESNDALNYFFYVGTTPDAMMKAFPLIEMVAGEPIPPGKKGFLFNEFVYERQIKNKVAVRLDIISKKLETPGATIAKSEELQQKIKENVAQSSELFNQISPRSAQELEPELRALLDSKTETMPQLLRAFFNMDDTNFTARKNFFYEKIAKHIVLYRMKVGDTFPLTAVSRSGSPNSVNVKIYGIFRFKGIENSPVSGYFSILDILTFRQLFGFMTPDRVAETKALEQEMNGSLSEFSSSSIDDLFSKDIEVLAKANTSNENTKMSAADEKINSSQKMSTLEPDTHTYSLEEMENGVTPNAAIVLKDPNRLNATLANLRNLFKEKGWSLRAEGWLNVSGALGQAAFVIKTILIAFMSIVYFIGVFIVANAVLMSTLQRTKEIGIMRAIGAQRNFVRKLILGEVLVMSSAFGALGVTSSLISVAWLGRVGIPAPSETLEFIFSGPRLFLAVSPATVAVSFFVAIAVSLLASLYPIRKAVKIHPITAMRAD